MRSIEAKSILGNHNNVNLYRGCTHDCIYCDSRSTCYQVGDFENIAVKSNAIELFEKELQKKRSKTVITTGSMCDPYIPIEKELMMTRKMLEVIKNYYFGVGILTKSDLVLRDIDLIEEINKRFGALICLTITTFDDDLCKKIERNVIPTSKRFAVLEEFSKRNIPTGIWMTPILPFINDDEENIIRIVERCVEVGVKYIIVFDFGTTKRDGSEQYFYKCLDKYFPGLKQKYIRTYGSKYDCRCLNADRLWEVFKKLCDEHNIIYDLGQVYKIFKIRNQGEQMSLF